MKEYEVYKLFTSPVFHFRVENHEELNTELESYILDLKKKYKNGQKKSNRGGWHSPFFDLTKDSPAKKFRLIIQKFTREVIINEMGWKYIDLKNKYLKTSNIQELVDYSNTQ